MGKSRHRDADRDTRRLGAVPRQVERRNGHPDPLADLDGLVDVRIAEQDGELRRLQSTVLEESDPASLDRKLREYFSGKMPETQMAAQIRRLTSPAFRRTLTYDPTTELKKLACRVLALYAVITILRGRSLAKRVPAEKRRWIDTTEECS